MPARRTISLHTLHCPECGAPAQVRPGQDVYQCRFCHASMAVEHAAPAPPPTAPPVRAFETPARRAPHAPVVPPVRSGGRGGLIVGAVGAVVAIGGVALALGTGVFSSWNGKEPLVCSGNDWVVVDHVTAKFSKGVAIDASGNCWVVCKDCQLSAPTVIRSRENGSVHLDHGSADGTVFDEVRDNADVSVDHTKVTGTKNEVSGSSINGAPPWPTSGPFVCGRANSGGEYTGVKVKVSSGAAVIGSINCHLKLKHCTLEGPVGLLLNDNADVELDDCEVHATDAVVARANGAVILEGGTFIGKDHAAVLADNANLRAHGTHFEGSKSTAGNATVQVE